MKKNKNDDIYEMTVWLHREIKKIESPEKNAASDKQDGNSELPVLYSVIMHDEKALDDEAKRKYKKYLAQQTAFAGAFAGAFALGKSSLLGAMVFGGPALLSPIPLVSVGIGIGVGRYIMKRVIPKGKNDINVKCSDKLSEMYAMCTKRISELSKILEENVKQSENFFLNKLPDALERLKEMSEKAAIQIDDLLNVDQNKRIMQYQEIALNQYNSQVELRKTLQQIVEAYNQLINENKKLALEIEQYKNARELCIITNNEFIN